MPANIKFIVAAVALSCTTACSTIAYNAQLTQPPADSSLVGTWRFAAAGEHKVLLPFFIKFQKDGICISGPTPFAVAQKANYTFDGKDIVIGPPDKPVMTIAGVTLRGDVMQFSGEDDDGEPLVLTYDRISPW